MRNHELKFTRARQYLEGLETEIAGWVKAERYTSAVVPNPQPPDYSIWVYAEPIPRDPFSLVLGDFLFNIRSGLDHLAYELAEAHSGKLSEKVAEDSEFPIFGNEDGKGARHFTRAAPKKLVGLDPQARAFIQAHQPYHRDSAAPPRPDRSEPRNARGGWPGAKHRL